MEQLPSSLPKKPSRFVKWSLIIGIVIVLNMFFNYAISLVYKEPVYPSSQPQVVEQFDTKEKCVAIGGQWNENVYPAPADQKNAPLGYCDPDYTKRMQYDSAHKLYQRNVFIILAVLGIVSLFVGVILGGEVIGTALSWGGVLSLIIASMRYWSEADNLVKVLILGVALGGLIWVAVRRFGK
ncbi:MAG TPA: hypothetical protein VG982_01600 [Candidatus Paceibacterota bacterium]|nr:hypothetical protein [Candidatus Paceibacterota bacterium]